ncbi:MAG: nonstructural protein [Microviridae sp.]|nr:MAG: nonstructural protein [Microviridae sp.]
MKIVVVCVRDIRANLFGNPIFVNSLGHALRQFEDEVNRPAEDNLLYKHPADFELYELGTFDSVSAEMELLKVPRQLTLGSSCVHQPALPAGGLRGNGASSGLGLGVDRPV